MTDPTAIPLLPYWHSLVLALAVALTILLGQQLRCLHPPTGGMAFLVVFLGVSWHFLLFPVLSGSLLLVLMAWALSLLVPGAMRYPLHWLEGLDQDWSGLQMSP